MTFYTKNQHGRYELNTEFFTELARNIAHFLGWQVEEEKASSVIDITDGTHSLRLSAYTTASNTMAANPKIEIRAMWNVAIGQSLWQFIPDAELKQHTTDISCSIKRGAESIARDIQKRLLPGYFLLWERGLQLKQQSEDSENRLRKLTQDLADIIEAYPHPNYKDGDKICTHPVLRDDIGIDVSVKNTISLDAEVRQAYNREEDIDSVKFNMTLPYDLAQEFMQWIASKTVSCFDTWHQEMIDHCIYYLNKEAKAAGQTEVKELPPNNFNWKQAYKDWFGEIHLSKNRLFNRFKQSIIDEVEIKSVEQTESESESESTQLQPQIESELVAESTTREDDIKALFINSPDQVEIFCRLSLHTPQQYRESLKDELLRIRDRRVLRTELETVRKIINQNPRYLKEERPKRILEILEQLDQLHSENQITILTKTLKKQFKTFKEAKLATSTKAVSWEKLAEKLAA